MIRRHLTADAVADHLEGLLPRAAAVEAESHLAECGDCAAIRTDLLAVREALAAQPVDPMPEAIALRIESVLASAWDDLSAARSAVSEVHADVAATQADLAATDEELASIERVARPGVMRRMRRRKLVPIFAAAVGTIGAVFTAVVIGPQLANVANDDNTGDVTVVAREEGDQGRSGQDEAGQSGALGEAEAGRQLRDSGFPPIPVSQSGRDYTSYTFAVGVADLLAAARTSSEESPFAPDSLISPGPSLSPGPSATPLAPGAAPSSTPPFPLAAPGQPLAPFADGGARLRACIRELAGADVEPILVDLGTFAGDPAVVVVLPDPADPASATARAVDPRCGTGLSVEETTLAVVTTPHPTAAPAPTQSPGVDQSTPLTAPPYNPGTPPT